MVRIMKKDGNRLEGIGERIDVRLTLIEEALGMTPGDPEIYGNWIASKAPEPEVGEGLEPHWRQRLRAPKWYRLLIWKQGTASQGIQARPQD